jgi:hypothetical protein
MIESDRYEAEAWAGLSQIDMNHKPESNRYEAEAWVGSSLSWFWIRIGSICNQHGKNSNSYYLERQGKAIKLKQVMCRIRGVNVWIDWESRQ